MKISVDTKEDSHDDLKKVIRMLQHLVGENQEIFTNEPSIAQEASPMANIFGDSSSAPETPAADSETAQETQPQASQEAAEETSQSTEDLFAELFSEEELKKMDTAKAKDEEEDGEEETKPKAKDKKHDIEFY